MLSEQVRTQNELDSREQAVDRRALPELDGTRPELVSDYLAPRNELERELVHIWEETLGIKPIGVLDDFYELGGDEQLATQIFAQIEQSIGASLAPATLQRAPTIAKLAPRVRRSPKSDAVSALIPVQPHGTKPPFFCVLPHLGDVSDMTQLANLLGKDQPFYGVQRAQPLADAQRAQEQREQELHALEEQESTGHSEANAYARARWYRQAGWGQDGSQGNASGVGLMAAYYVQQMRARQPKGPYTLGGRCFGGTIALEMAQQLIEQGEQVSLLALFGSAPPGYRPATEHMLDRLAYHRKQGRLLSVLFFYLRVKLAKIPSWLRRQRNMRANQRARKLAERSSERGESAAPAFMERYVPRVYPGRITLFDTTSQTRAAWAKLAAGGVDLHVISGTHHDIFWEPGVHEFAKRLSACLAEAQQEATEAR